MKQDQRHGHTPATASRKVRRTLSVAAGLALLTAAALPGCNAKDETAAATTSAPSYRPLGYVMLLDGTMGVVDMLTMQKVNEVKVGHSGIHQVAVVGGGRTVYTGNLDDQTLVKLQFSDDGKSVKQTVLGKSPVNLHMMTASPDGRWIVVTSRMELADRMKAPPSTLPNDSIAVIDTTSDKVVKVIALQSPAMATFPIDGKHMYVNNCHNGTVSVIDVATWSEVDRWNVSDKPLTKGADGFERVSPDGIDVSPDGKWLATADYEAGTITVWEVANKSNKRQISYNDGVRMPHDVRFTPDSKGLWVTDYDRIPAPADEVGNATIKTHLRVYDVATLAINADKPMGRTAQRISLPQYAKTGFLTTAIGSVLQLDRETLELQGEVALGELGRPVVCGMATY